MYIYSIKQFYVIYLLFQLLHIVLKYIWDTITSGTSKEIAKLSKVDDFRLAWCLMLTVQVCVTK